MTDAEARSRRGTVSSVRMLGAMSLALAVAATSSAAPRAGAGKKAPVKMTDLHRVGPRILNGDGQAVFLHGVNLSGYEFYRSAGPEFSQWPLTQPVIDAMKAWNVNLVHLLLNEDWWLGSTETWPGGRYDRPPNPQGPPDPGPGYRAVVKAAVDLAVQNNLAVIIGLQWSAPDETISEGQQAMPDAPRSVDFWRSVASTFAAPGGDGKYGGVMFELFTEPFPDDAGRLKLAGPLNAQTAFAALLLGGDAAPGLKTDPGGNPDVASVPYVAAGMQSLLDAVRGAGARNLVLVGSPSYSSRPQYWVQYMPNDRLGNIAAAVDTFLDGDRVPFPEQRTEWLPAILAAGYPFIYSSFGGNQAKERFWAEPMEFATAHKQHFAAWTWNDWAHPGYNNHALTANYAKGEPSQYGKDFQKRMRGLPDLHSGPIPRWTPPPNLLRNPDFEDGRGSDKEWRVVATAPAAATHAITTEGTIKRSNALAVTASAADAAQPWNLRLTQDGLKLAPATTYRLHFRARSPTAGMAVTAALHAEDGLATAAASAPLPLTSLWGEYEAMLRYDGPAGAPASVSLAFPAGEIEFDALELIDPAALSSTSPHR